MAVWAGLTIAEKRRGAKSKGEKESYIHLQSSKEQKDFLSDQCKEIDETNRMGKTRDLYKKISDAKGTFHAKMGTINDRSSMDLREAEDI